MREVQTIEVAIDFPQRLLEFLEVRGMKDYFFLYTHTHTHTHTRALSCRVGVSDSKLSDLYLCKNFEVRLSSAYTTSLLSHQPIALKLHSFRFVPWA